MKRLLFKAREPRPFVHRLGRSPWWMTLLIWVCAFAVMVCVSAGAALLIMAGDVRSAQFERVHLQGMQVGMSMCGGGGR